MLDEALPRYRAAMPAGRTGQLATRPIVSFSLAEGEPLAAGAIEALEEDGVVCLNDAFGPVWLEVIEAGIDEAVEGMSDDLSVVQRDGDAGSFSFSSGAWQSVEPFRRFIFESHLPDIAWSLLDTKQLGLFYDFLLIKQPRSDSAATPWHQDHSYYPLDGFKVINSWVALDEIPVETTLRFLAGSHRAGTLYRAVDFEDPGADYRHARHELPVPPVGETEAEVLASPLRPGDMLVWKSYTLHSAPGNTLNRRRAAFSVNWVGDDIVFNGKPSLGTYRDPSQVIGESIVCDRFPQVRGA